MNAVKNLVLVKLLLRPMYLLT